MWEGESLYVIGRGYVYVFIVYVMCQYHVCLYNIYVSGGSVRDGERCTCAALASRAAVFTAHLSAHLHSSTQAVT